MELVKELPEIFEEFGQLDTRIFKNYRRICSDITKLGCKWKTSSASYYSKWL